jgi:Xaa-Pro dipeptidase
MLELGSERHDWALNLPDRNTDPPLGRRLQAGDYITNEVSAVWGGQLAQEDQPILLGPVPDELKPLIELQRQLWHESLAEFRPGRTFGDILKFIAEFGPRHGVKTSVTAHGRGLGNEGPIITPRTRGAAIDEVQLQRGNCFVWKPTVASADGQYDYVWAGDIVVTDNGAEALPKRPVDLISIT